MSRRRVERRWLRWSRHIDRLEKLCAGEHKASMGMQRAFNRMARAFNRRLPAHLIEECEVQLCHCHPVGKSLPSVGSI